MLDSHTAIRDFLNAAAAKQPTPGGGAVTALTGALAAAMGEMVLQYSVAKKDLARFAETNAGTLASFTELRHGMLDLMAEDQTAFATLTDVKKAGGDTAALVEACIEVPNQIAIGGLLTLSLAEQVAGTSNPYLASDLAVCGELAAAVVRGAVHSIRANLTEIDAERLAYWNDRCAEFIERADDDLAELLDAIRDARGPA